MFFTSASLWKMLSDHASEFFADMPEALRVVFEFVWKARWFIIALAAMVIIYNIIMVVLPYIIWMVILKQVFGGFLTLFTLGG